VDLGNRIRDIRIRKRRSLKEIAERTGLTTSFLSQVERNFTSPSLKSLEKIAGALDTETGCFLEENKAKESSLIKDNRVFQYKCEKCGWINNYRFECEGKPL
jgi:transcriptional regulator with XRE-family HTH domain